MPHILASFVTSLPCTLNQLNTRPGSFLPPKIHLLFSPSTVSWLVSLLLFLPPSNLLSIFAARMIFFKTQGWVYHCLLKTLKGVFNGLWGFVFVFSLPLTALAHLSIIFLTVLLSLSACQPCLLSRLKQSMLHPSRVCAVSPTNWNAFHADTLLVLFNPSSTFF